MSSVSGSSSDPAPIRSTQGETTWRWGRQRRSQRCGGARARRRRRLRLVARACLVGLDGINFARRYAALARCFHLTQTRLPSTQWVSDDSGWNRDTVAALGQAHRRSPAARPASTRGALNGTPWASSSLRSIASSRQALGQGLTPIASWPVVPPDSVATWDAAPALGARRLPRPQHHVSHEGAPHERHWIRRPARSPHLGQRARADGGRPGRLPWHAVRSPAGGRAASGRADARRTVGGRARGRRLRAAAAAVQGDGRSRRAGHRWRLADRQRLVPRPRRRSPAGDGVDPRRRLRLRLVRRSPLRRRRPGP